MKLWSKIGSLLLMSSTLMSPLCGMEQEPISQVSVHNLINSEDNPFIQRSIKSCIHNDNDKDVIQKLEKLPGSCALGLTKAYGITYFTTYMHELGHALALRALFNAKPKIVMNSINPSAAYTIANYPAGMKTVSAGRSITMLLAGPLFGFAASLGILKAHTIFDEYYGKEKTFTQACKDGMGKKLLHEEESVFVQLAALSSAISNLIDLNPYRKGPVINGKQVLSDGGQILKILKILGTGKK